MGRREDLEQHVLDSNKLLRELEQKLLLSSDTKERLRLEKEIKETREKIWEYESEVDLLNTARSTYSDNNTKGTTPSSESKKDARLDHLIPALKDLDPKLRRQAAEALGLIKDKYSVEPLIEALKDPDIGVRWRAARALGQIMDKRALPALKELAGDSKFVAWISEDKSAATDAIKKINKQKE